MPINIDPTRVVRRIDIHGILQALHCLHYQLGFAESAIEELDDRVFWTNAKAIDLVEAIRVGVRVYEKNDNTNNTDTPKVSLTSLLLNGKIEEVPNHSNDTYSYLVPDNEWARSVRYL